MDAIEHPESGKLGSYATIPLTNSYPGFIWKVLEKIWSFYHQQMRFTGIS
jgi:hypothetical protein